MDGQKKNNRFIRLLGKLGRKVKFLQTPLKVLVVVGVSVHHLFRKLFFDVNYHAARMRLLMGTMCAALLLTLFVIPAIADEMDLLNVEIVEETPTPTPTPEIELIEGETPVQEGTDNEVIPLVPTVEETAVNPDDAVVPVDPETVPEATDPGAEGVQPGTEGDGTSEGVVPTEGADAVSYGVDENGNPLDENGNPIIPDETNAPKKGPAVKMLMAALPDEKALAAPTLTVNLNTSTNSFDYGDDIPLKATPTNTVTDADLGTGCTYVSSEWEYVWYVKQGSNEKRKMVDSLTKDLNEFTANRTDFYSWGADKGAFRRFYGSDKDYVFSCEARQTITYEYIDGGETKTGKVINTTLSDEPTITIHVNKKELKNNEFTLAPALEAYPAEVAIRTNNNGNPFKNPELKSPSTYPDLTPNAFKYRFVGTNTGLFPKVTAGSGEKYYLFKREDTYNLYLLMDEDSENYTMETSPVKTVKMFCNKNQTIEPEDLVYTMTPEGAPVTGVDSNKWVSSLSIGTVSSKSGFTISTNVDDFESYSNPFVAEEGGPDNMVGYPVTCPKELRFAYENEMVEKSITPNYGGNQKIYIDKTGPTINKVAFKDGDPNVTKVVKDPTKPLEVTYYVKGDFDIEVEITDIQNGDHDGSGVKTAQYCVYEAGTSPAEGDWKDLTKGTGAGEYKATVSVAGINENKGGVVKVRARDFVDNKSEDNPINQGKDSISFDMKDKEPPYYTVKETGVRIEKNTATGATEDAIIYITDKRTVTIDVKDDASGVNTTTYSCDGGSAEPTSDGMSVNYTSSVTSMSQPRTLTFSDNAGNSSTILVKFILSNDQVYTADTSLITIPEADYGDEVPAVDAQMFVEGQLQADQHVEIKGDIKVELEDGKDGSGVFQVPEVSAETGTFKVKPVKGLGVNKAAISTTDVTKGDPYLAYLIVNYTLYKGDSVVDQHVVRRPVTFTVNPKKLTMKYKGSTEPYHTREYQRVTTDWFTNNIQVSGFITGEDISVLEGYVPVIAAQGSAEGATAEIAVSTDDGALTTDGYVIKKGKLILTPKDGKPFSATSSTSKNHNYYYAGDSFHGKVDVERKVFKDIGGKNLGYTIKPTSHYNEDMWYADDTGKVAEDNEWYVENMQIESSDTSKYLVFDATDEPGYGDKLYEIQTSDDNTAVKSKFGGYSEEFQDPDDGSEVKKYFYIYDVETGEVSDITPESIKIDTSDPGEFSNSGAEPTLKKEDTTMQADQDGTWLPFFYIEDNVWREFLKYVTVGLYFNDTMDLVIRHAVDKQSEVASTEYWIDPTRTEYTEKDALVGAASGKWTEFTGTGNIPETTGYIYVKITNKAGLEFYLNSEKYVIFDSKGPKVTASFHGERHRGKETEPENGLQSDITTEVQDKDEYVASDKVKLTIEDEQKLYTGDETDPAIRIYKGVNASASASVWKMIVCPDDTKAEVELDPAELEAVSGWCTVVAKDNSGLVTTNYFKIVKPEFRVKLDSLTFDTLTYGTAPSQELKMTYSNAGNARAEITSVTFDSPYFSATQKGTNNYSIKPVQSETTKLEAGTIETTMTANYNGGAKATAKCRITIRKKLLVATYAGATIYKGQKLTVQPGDIKVEGFIEGESAANAASYVAPTVTVPEYPSETMIITPKGGSAKNYRFDDAANVGGVVTVLTDKAARNTHYTVEGTLSSTGWYISNIKIKPKTGYSLTTDAAGNSPTSELTLTDDTNAGEAKFYIKDASTGKPSSGEVYEQSVFNYKKDVVPPLITGASEGQIYKANSKKITVTDDYLYRVAVNGIRKEVKNNKAEFDILADQKQSSFFITAEDYAGHISSVNMSMMQLDGADDDDIPVAEDPNYNPDDDVIEDSTKDGGDTDLGTLTKKVQLIDGAPTTTFCSSNSDLKSGVLTSNERAVMKEGSDANITLRVQNINGSVSQADKELVIAALGDYTVGMYLDITLWKTVGNGDEKQVSSTKKPISLSITIPESLRRSKSGKVREFAIVRVHGGSATVLQDQDSAVNTVTVSSSKFSVYALAYRDVDESTYRKNHPTNNGTGNNGNPGGGGQGSGSNGGGGSGAGSGSGGGGSAGYGIETDGVGRAPQTGDTAPILPTAIGFGAALLGMIIAVIIRRRMNYEWVYVDEDGNIIEEETTES